MNKIIACVMLSTTVFTGCIHGVYKFEGRAATRNKSVHWSEVYAGRFNPEVYRKDAMPIDVRHSDVECRKIGSATAPLGLLTLGIIPLLLEEEAEISIKLQTAVGPAEGVATVRTKNWVGPIFGWFPYPEQEGVTHADGEALLDQKIIEKAKDNLISNLVAEKWVAYQSLVDKKKSAEAKVRKELVRIEALINESKLDEARALIDEQQKVIDGVHGLCDAWRGYALEIERPLRDLERKLKKAQANKKALERKQAEEKRAQERTERYERDLARAKELLAAPEPIADTLVFKRLYLGMPIDDARALMANYLGKKDGECLCVAENGKVTAFVFSRWAVDTMFNAKNMSVNTLRSNFCRAYGVDNDFRSGSRQIDDKERQWLFRTAMLNQAGYSSNQPGLLGGLIGTEMVAGKMKKTEHYTYREDPKGFYIEFCNDDPDAFLVIKRIVAQKEMTFD